MKKCKLIVVLVALAFTLSVNAGHEPWWKNPRGINLNWKPFTGLPKLSGPSYLEIQERTGEGTHKFFAVSLLPSRNFYVADAGTKPVFTEVPMTSDFIIYSTAMVRWNKPYDEFFVGTNSGLWRFDEDLGTFVCEWYWTWDPLCKIASIGNGICGIVSSWGSQSGIHVWKPDGTHTFKSAGARFGDLNIWGDPISHKYGYDWDYYTRIAPSGKSSITLKMDSGKSAYSLNGGVKFYSPVGTRKDKEDFSYFDDFRPYTNSTVILKPVNLRSGGLIMGNLGGYFYPIPIQCEELDTFFYSPNTRLMIAGLARENKLFYAVLPEPNTIWLPKLHTKNIPGKTIVSWDSKQNPLRLEMSTNKVSWKKVTNRKITEHGVTKVVVPDYKHRLHFRLVHP